MARVYQIGEPYRPSALGVRGTVVYRPVRYRYRRWETPSPCCPPKARRLDSGYLSERAAGSAAEPVRLPARDSGQLASCPGCGWRYLVIIDYDNGGQLQARWESLGPSPGRGWRRKQ
jgi:hypothetical protein